MSISSELYSRFAVAAYNLCRRFPSQEVQNAMKGDGWEFVAELKNWTWLKEYRAIKTPEGDTVERSPDSGSLWDKDIYQIRQKRLRQAIKAAHENMSERGLSDLQKSSKRGFQLTLQKPTVPKAKKGRGLLGRLDNQ